MDLGNPCCIPDLGQPSSGSLKSTLLHLRSILEVTDHGEGFCLHRSDAVAIPVGNTQPIAHFQLKEALRTTNEGDKSLPVSRDLRAC